jgi:diguanylate cyclase
MGADLSFKKAAQNAQQTIALLEDRNIKKIPQNYTIWYEYLSDENPDIKDLVNRLIAENGTFNDEVAQQIYNEFFSSEKESREIRETNRMVQQSMEAILREIRSSTSGLSSYEETLEEFAGNAETLSAADLQFTVRNIIAETRQMSDQSSALNINLEKASSEISDLKRKLERIEGEALTDALTGIANRKKFDRDLTKATSACKSKKGPLCLVMSDIDHFKKFNDDHGHLFGDQVLRLVAQTLQKETEGEAIAARYGGEEFGIILPNTSLHSAVRLANGMRESVSAKELIKRNTGDNVGRITMSFGVAQFDPSEDIDSFIARADSALYSAKAAGRNQVQIELNEISQTA